MTIQTVNYGYRLLARVVIVAETPLSIGSGEKDIISDALVARDVNGVPYIPGTTIAGVVRNMLNVGEKDTLWGYQVKKEGRGSEIIFTEARIMDSKGRVVDGLIDRNTIAKDSVLACYQELPVRQHVCITEAGVAAKTGKFDAEIVYKGSKFCFEIEIVASSDETNRLDEVLKTIRKRSFRLGGGTRNGFGQMSVESIKTKVIDLHENMSLYLDKSSNLQESAAWWKGVPESETLLENDKDYIHYELKLSPEDFFIFGSGYGDESGAADMTSVSESIIKKGKHEGGKTLIPATSVKGALRHRVAYHYNKIIGRRIGDGESYKIGDNEAVRKLFGYQDVKAHIGNVIISDVFLEPVKSEFIPHVNIDRFTGGALKGALFNENPNYGKGMPRFSLNVEVKKDVIDADSNFKDAFENALKDIRSGMLPLGGGVNRGNGVFNGEIFKDGEKI